VDAQAHPQRQPEKKEVEVRAARKLAPPARTLQPKIVIKTRFYNQTNVHSGYKQLYSKKTNRLQQSTSQAQIIKEKIKIIQKAKGSNKAKCLTC
jgi:hypothetical protein